MSLDRWNTPVRTFQIWSNAFIKDKRLPWSPLLVRAEPSDHQPDARTKGRIRAIKFALGYTDKYADYGLTDRLLRQLQHPLWRSLFTPIQWQRGLRYRAAQRRQVTDVSSTAGLARAILNHKNAIFAYVSPTGGSARAGLVAASEGRKSYYPDTGVWTYIDRRILVFLYECVKRGPTWINCVVNGDHLDFGDHPKGEATDIDKSTRSWIVYAAAKVAGVNVLNEDAYHWHVWV